MNRTEELKKGCGCKLMSGNNCHEHYLCEICQACLKEHQKDLKEELEFNKAWASLFWQIKDCECCKCHKSKLDERIQAREQELGRN